MADGDDGPSGIARDDDPERHWLSLVPPVWEEALFHAEFPGLMYATHWHDVTDDHSIPAMHYFLLVDTIPHLEARRRLESVSALTQALAAALAGKEQRGEVTRDLEQLARAASPTLRVWRGPGLPPGWPMASALAAPSPAPTAAAAAAGEA